MISELKSERSESLSHANISEIGDVGDGCLHFLAYTLAYLASLPKIHSFLPDCGSFA